MSWESEVPGDLDLELHLYNIRYEQAREREG